jgi:hypothetical protein
MDSVLQLEDCVWQALVAKDSNRLAAMFSDDYIEVTADGKRVMKDSIVETSPQVDDIESYEMTNASTLELGPDTTILSYHLVLKGKLRGEPIDPPDRWVVSVWQRREHRWQCCFFQQTAADADI